MHACVSACMCMHVGVGVHACTYMCVCAGMCIDVCACMHVCTCVCVCVYVCVCMRASACVRACVHVCVYACVCNSMQCKYVRMYIYVHTSCTYIHMCCNACKSRLQSSKYAANSSSTNHKTHVHKVHFCMCECIHVGHANRWQQTTSPKCTRGWTQRLSSKSILLPTTTTGISWYKIYSRRIEKKPFTKKPFISKMCVCGGGWEDILMRKGVQDSSHLPKSCKHNFE